MIRQGVSALGGAMSVVASDPFSEPSVSALKPLVRVQHALQALAFGLILAVALGALAVVALTLAGLVPPLDLTVHWAGQPVPDAGLWLEGAVAALFLLLTAFLPAAGRMLRLERAHRDFTVRMEDVAAAYAAAHRADREGVFTLSAEFDSVRERLDHLRKHPDLGNLEPEILELAAQMSHISRDLARVYSDDKVARARTFLTQRQQEVAQTRDRIRLAQYAASELKRWLQDVEADERLVSAQIERLDQDLREVLPALGYAVEDVPANVVPLASKPK